MKVRDFLKVNGLKQVDLARYLGITEAAVSNAVKGKSEFSPENLIKIKSNPYGWDTSMLKSDQSENPVEEKPSLVAENVPQLSNAEILLREMLAEERARNEALNEVIWELKEENGRLKGELASGHKGGDAKSAGSSSSADAV